MRSRHVLAAALAAAGSLLLAALLVTVAQAAPAPEPEPQGETSTFPEVPFTVTHDATGLCLSGKAPATGDRTGVVVVEGVCALHRMFRDDYDVRVWVDAPYDVRLERGVARDGEASRRTWVERWMPSEDRYVERDDPIACAHVIVDGSRPLGG